ncbi:hypothetical protein K2W90_04085 [Candidatus Babeliales bacterium]|nr:hypothetical protein [Candidatus Babeliales bacterium]
MNAINKIFLGVALAVTLAGAVNAAATAVPMPQPKPNHGALNNGSDCFLNSTVQALFHSKPLRDYLEWADDHNVYRQPSPPTLLINHIAAMAQSPESINPKVLRQRLCADGSSIQAMCTGHQDAQEFVSYLIDQLSENFVDLENAKEDITTQFRQWLLGLAPGSDSTQFIDTIITRFFNRLPLGNEYTQESIVARFCGVLSAIKTELLENECVQAINSGDAVAFQDLCLRLADSAMAAGDNRSRYVLCRNILESNVMTPEKFIGLIKTLRTFKNITRPTIIENLIKKVKDAVFSFFKFNREGAQGWEARKIIVGKLIYNALDSNEDAIPALWALMPDVDDYFYFIYDKLSGISAQHVETIISSSQIEQLETYVRACNWQPLVHHVNSLVEKKRRVQDIFAVKMTDGASESALSVALPEKTTTKVRLQDLLTGYFNERPLGAVRATQLPEVLMIQLKRFEAPGLRNNARVTFPVNGLDLSDYVADPSLAHGAYYNLVAVVNQTGSLQFGHYVAAARSYENYKWYYYNDEQVCDLALPHVQHLASADLTLKFRSGRSHNYTTAPYLLFYVKSSRPFIAPGMKLDRVASFLAEFTSLRTIPRALYNVGALDQEPAAMPTVQAPHKQQELRIKRDRNNGLEQDAEKKQRGSSDLVPEVSQRYSGPAPIVEWPSDDEQEAPANDEDTSHEFTSESDNLD